MIARAVGARRVLVALAAATLAVSGLTACQSKVGAAAYVGAHRITESSINNQVHPLTEAEAAVVGIPTATQIGSVRSLVLQYEIRNELMDRMLASLKIRPLAEQLNEVHDAALNEIFGGSSDATGAAGDDALLKAVTSIGADPGFAKTILLSTQKELIVRSETGAQDATGVAAELAKLKVAVKVSPRYGNWNAKSLEVTSAELPSFLKVAERTEAAANEPAVTGG